ncbi:MAG TPA: GNAT family N-acetyltransferase [Terracidiphilus sp.]|nr:GNAT family N-acetyltransferase [Terracidiphilus sp.]
MVSGSTTVLYRPYEAGDFAALYAIEEASFEPPFRFTAAYLRRLLENPRAATWVAEEQGVLAGFAVINCKGEPGRTIAYIDTIEVTQGRRGQGIGGALLNHIEDSAKAASASRIWLHVDAENTSAIRLYETHGYALEGKKEGFYPQKRAALIYAKRFQ